LESWAERNMLHRNGLMERPAGHFKPTSYFSLERYVAGRTSYRRNQLVNIRQNTLQNNKNHRLLSMIVRQLQEESNGCYVVVLLTRITPTPKNIILIYCSSGSSSASGRWYQSQSAFARFLSAPLSKSVSNFCSSPTINNQHLASTKESLQQRSFPEAVGRPCPAKVCIVTTAITNIY